MKFLEKDLEEIIFQNKKEINDKGLPFYGYVKRQLKIGNYGIADLVTFSKSYEDLSYYDFIKKEYVFKTEPVLDINLYELKKDKVGLSALLQAYGYLKGINHWFDENRPNIRISTCIYLVGKTIDKSGSFCFLPDFIDDLHIYTYDYSLDGISFKKENNYKLIHSGF